MNILETVGKYAADFNNPGVMLVYVPRELNLDGGGVQTPGIFDVSGDNQFDRTRLRQIRAEAMEANQLRILFVASMGVPGDFTPLDQEVDVTLSVEFGVSAGWVKVIKFRSVEEKPKDTAFIYEA
ncbi:hypothetical protein BIZ78_gp059 [Erwinia phage vB_EamM_Caitlin]|uniref:hypothetical protein n=1 Tax=Erwinia phage vB_EamM_Caitlin TaxID=1883379 RepID=UPI00081D1A4E|nr:hypothetical protein BIZ78_gp059 [Erwinia phage vB_EamM_Caitlin]ANZ48516.1 hypothetical protein CAITLIN_221 [Erwinia phage vB_EamM_Caitlin]